MDGLKIMILFILFLLAADLFMLRPVRKTKQDERREAYQAQNPSVPVEAGVRVRLQPSADHGFGASVP